MTAYGANLRSLSAELLRILSSSRAACQSLHERSAAHKIDSDSDVSHGKREVRKTFVHASAVTDAPLSLL
jgi:hypothetical protein